MHDISCPFNGCHGFSMHRGNTLLFFELGIMLCNVTQRYKMSHADQTPAWVAFMHGDIKVRPAQQSEAAEVAAILREAAVWLEQRGMPLWQPSAFEPDRLALDIAS